MIPLLLETCSIDSSANYASWLYLNSLHYTGNDSVAVDTSLSSTTRESADSIGIFTTFI